MYIDGNNLRLSATELSAAYTAPQRDVGYVATFSITIEAIAVVTSSLTFNSDAVRKFSDSTTLRFVGEEIGGSLSFEIRTSEDDITWTDWKGFHRGDFYCRYFQLRMTMTRDALDIALACTRFDYATDLPDVDEFSDGNETISVAATGVDIAFSKTYHETPAVSVAIMTGSGIYSKITSLDTTGFTVHLYNAAGVVQTGDFNWKSHGI